MTHDRRRRRVTAAVAVAALAGSCSSAPAPALDDLPAREAVLAFVAAQQDDDRSEYSAPDRDARDDLSSAVVALGQARPDEARRLAARQDYAVVALDGGALALAPATLPDDRGWGLFVVRPGGLDLAVEVPHPRADLGTEHLGAEVADASGARYLLVAGAGRRAADGAADVAHQERSVFSAVHARLADEGVPALQLHGYAPESLPGVDLVVSPGSSERSPLADAVADAGSAAGLEVCRAWERRCGRLEGRTNVQGRATRETGGVFVHLEVTRRLRTPEGRPELVRLLARALAS